MRTLARAAAGSLALLCAALALVAVAVAAIGIAGTRSAASQGNVIADDELITAVVTGQLARDIDAAYAAGRAAVLTTDEAERARLLGTLYTSLLPAVDARLFALERLHAADPPAERADIALVVRQWTAVRDRLSPPALTSGAAAAGRLTAAYQPVSAHLDGLFRREFDDGQADHRDASAGAARVTGLITGAAALGIVIGLQVIGSVLLSRPAPYSEAEEQRIRDSVGQAAPVLANLRNLPVAEIRAATDGLTGLPNKRGVIDALKRTFAQAATTKAPLALLLLDLDHFKQVNDQGGHAVGDQVLANVGATLRGVLRARDFAGRNGGEEFAVLLPDTEIEAALEIAERVRAAIAEISLPGTDVSVTASIGVSGFPGQASTLDRLERLADAALYLAKRQGRNRVELAESPLADAPQDPTAAGPAQTSAGPALSANGSYGRPDPQPAAGPSRHA
jgi:diguanylate cyclase (GGDEF)-like protein